MLFRSHVRRGSSPWGGALSDGGLVDTQLLIRLACSPDRLGRKLAQELSDRNRPILYSLVSLWDVAIQACLSRPDFHSDANALRQDRQREGFRELAIAAEHVPAVQHLRWIHRGSL